jgi:drug/metabolite transporter (DMT)-like permease
MTLLELSIVLVSAILHAGWNAYAKDNPNPTAFLAIMGAMTVCAGLALLPFVDLSMVPRDVWWLLAGTGVIHTFYQIFLGRSYERGDLSVVYPIARSTPAFVALIAIPLLDDPVSPAGGGGIGIVMLGMWLVHTEGRVSWRALTAPGIGYAYLTLLATVGYSITDKLAMAKLRATEWTQPVPSAVVYFFLLTAAHTALFVPYALARVPRSAFRAVLGERWGRLLVGVAGSVISYVLILEALRTASVSYVTAVRQTSVVFAAAIAAVMLKERPSRPRVLGSVLTVAGVGLIALFP